MHRTRHWRVSTCSAEEWIVCLEDRRFHILPWRKRQYVSSKCRYLSSTRSLGLGRRNIIHQRMVLYKWSVSDMDITRHRVFRHIVFYWRRVNKAKYRDEFLLFNALRYYSRAVVPLIGFPKELSVTNQKSNFTWPSACRLYLA